MPEQRHILTFICLGERFAVDSTAVKEIVQLLELTPAEEMPDYVVGVFNLRGHIVPVVDLNLRFGHAQERYRINDRIIIVETQHVASLPIFGIIVSEVHDVISVSEKDIEPLHVVTGGERTQHLVRGEVKAGEQIIMLLDHNNLVGILEAGAEIIPYPHTGPLAEGEGITPVPSMGGMGRGWTAFEPTPEEQAIFRSRALTLIQPPVEAVSRMLSFAVVSLGGECFGVDLEVVKEFADVREVTPVPCTPPHIVGDMNLRGEIMTLVDICGALNMSANLKGSRAVICMVNGLPAGVTVDDVIEVINVSPDDVKPVPISVKASGNEYIKGEFPYYGKMLSILDMAKILTGKEIVVDEE